MNRDLNLFILILNRIPTSRYTIAHFTTTQRGFTDLRRCGGSKRHSKYVIPCIKYSLESIMHKVLFGIQSILDSIVNLFICNTKLSNALQVSGDEVRIHSKCCKGVISFVGKGGAIRVQRGILNMTSSTFTNNTARLLGTVGLPKSCLCLFLFPILCNVRGESRVKLR